MTPYPAQEKAALVTPKLSMETLNLHNNSVIFYPLYETLAVSSFQCTNLIVLDFLFNVMFEDMYIHIWEKKYLV